MADMKDADFQQWEASLSPVWAAPVGGVQDKLANGDVVADKVAATVRERWDQARSHRWFKRGVVLLLLLAVWVWPEGSARSYAPAPTAPAVSAPAPTATATAPARGNTLGDIASGNATPLTYAELEEKSKR